MPRLRVVFDTNFCKTSKADFETLLARERQHSILAMANPLVVQEILSHVADARDKDFAYSLAAMRKLRRPLCSSVSVCPEEKICLTFWDN